MNPEGDHINSVEGCLIGCAVGDSLGLPTEGLSPRRIEKECSSPLRQRLVLGFGMCSDDTEHLFFTAQALLRSQGDTKSFRLSLARSLRFWFLSVPAGMGFATARACMKLCIGVAPEKSGVASAGNGPAMRAPLLGVYTSDQPERQRDLTDASTRLTHTHPDAITGARLIAAMAGYLTEGLSPVDGLRKLKQIPELVPHWKEWLSILENSLTLQESVSTVAERLGLQAGVSGYICHTVPMVLYTVVRNPEHAMEGLEALIRCGGDTDTTAAIAGALYGAKLGPHAFPQHVIQTIQNGPMSIAVLKKAAQALDQQETEPVSWNWPLIPIRNLFFLLVVLCHGFRRLFPTP